MHKITSTEGGSRIVPSEGDTKDIGIPTTIKDENNYEVFVHSTTSLQNHISF